MKSLIPPVCVLNNCYNKERKLKKIALKNFNPRFLEIYLFIYLFIYIISSFNYVFNSKIH